jgi:GNAT superfamily N-acetyltransferase
MNIAWHYADVADCDLLADWNLQLIADEGHRNPMNVVQLRERMRGWIATDYKAVIFSAVEPVGYALFKTEADSIYLRQFFIRRDKRRSGIGKEAFDVLRNEVWPRNIRLTVDVLCANEVATAFWRALGFRDYFLGLEMMQNPTP